MASRILLPLLLLALASVVSSASAEPVYTLNLHHAFAPGDSYRHSVAVAKRGEASTRILSEAREVRSGATYLYEADVEVVEVDEEGLPLREIHRDASLAIRNEGKLERMLPERTVLHVRYRRGGPRFERDGGRLSAELVRNQRIGELNQVSGDAGTVHNLSGKNEKRHGKKRKQVKPGKHSIRRHGQETPPAHIEDTDHTGNAKHKPNRHPEHEKPKEDSGYHKHVLVLHPV